MSKALPISLSVGNLPLNFEGTADELFQAMRLRMKGIADATGILTGNTVSITAPISNVGPWFDGKMWWFWNNTMLSYTPEVHRLDGPNPDINTTIKATPTKSRLVFIQDKSGEMLLVNDIYVPRAMVILNSLPLTIDWSKSNDFIHVLKANSRIFMVGFREGQEIRAYVYNSATAFSCNWPIYTLWPGGIEPTMPVSQAGQSHCAEFTFVSLNGLLYGELTSVSIQSATANTVFVGGSDTSTGKEPSSGFHSQPTSTPSTGLQP